MLGSVWASWVLDLPKSLDPINGSVLVEEVHAIGMSSLGSDIESITSEWYRTAWNMPRTIMTMIVDQILLKFWQKKEEI